MSNQIQVFENSEFGAIRVIEVNGQPWFVGKDVTDALAYRNSRDALRAHVDDDDRADVAIHDGRQNRQMTIINESGLYSLILSSKLPAARAFKRWITTIVLPAIRKYGAYINDDTLRRLREDATFAEELLRRMSDERRNNAVLLDYVAKIEPKVRYYDIILQCGGLISTSAIAKDYRMGPAAFNKLLHEMGIQFKSGRTWLLYQRYAGKGYTVTRTCTIDDKVAWVHTWWTPKGRAWLYDLLHRRGYLTEAEKFTKEGA